MLVGVAGLKGYLAKVHLLLPVASLKLKEVNACVIFDSNKEIFQNDFFSHFLNFVDMHTCPRMLLVINAS